MPRSRSSTAPERWITSTYRALARLCGRDADRTTPTRVRRTARGAQRRPRTRRRTTQTRQRRLEKRCRTTYKDEIAAEVAGQQNSRLRQRHEDGIRVADFTIETIEFFNHFGYPFEVVDVLENMPKRDVLAEMTNWPTLPKVFINGKFYGDTDILARWLRRANSRPCYAMRLGGEKRKPRRPSTCGNARGVHDAG